MAQRISTVQRRRAGAGLRRAEVRRARPARPATRSPRAASASTRCARAIADGQRQPARPARSTATDQRLHRRRPSGQLTDAAAYRPLIVAYRNGSPVRLRGARPRASTASRTTRPRPGSTTSARDHPRRPAPAGHEHGRGGRARSSALLPTLRAQLPAVGQARRPLRPLGVDPRLGRRRQVHAAADAGAGGAGDLPLPAQRLGDVIPSLALPLSIIGTFAVMYLLGFSLDNLSLMALTLCGRLRGRRRHRHAREHRAPHGDGRDAASRRRSTARARSASRSSR